MLPWETPPYFFPCPVSQASWNVKQVQQGKTAQREAVQEQRKPAWKFPHLLLSLLQFSGVLKRGEIPVGGNVKCVFVWSWDWRVAVWERSFGSRVVFSLREIHAVARGRFQERSCCCCHRGKSHWEQSSTFTTSGLACPEPWPSVQGRPCSSPKLYEKQTHTLEMLEANIPTPLC